ncbi:methylamine utilization protein [Shewanella hanedai]|uniref:Methylamine utilization protein n=1 Tax=Shewanella hanedai TaxID=25 RepID=A0A553JRF9_SHEHA|nr:plastocyanin/azurin family copper-binding protein [Shewanella hanedai]TRY15053.1 methylamine utilization protein [Shewanella hanedai]GGI75172.1 methylamine utilization protein [Shewanella hanedai]
MRLITLPILMLSMFSVSTFAEEHVVSQKNKSFSENKISINVGDTVHFLNKDPFFHNIFSLSDEQYFDLGSYPKDESRSVVFDTPGEIEVECAIHSKMFLLIEVKKSEDN